MSNIQIFALILRLWASASPDWTCDARGIHELSYQLDRTPRDALLYDVISRPGTDVVHYGNARKKDEIWSRSESRAAERRGRLWSGHRTWSRSAEDKGLTARKDVVVVSEAPSRTWWRNAQLPHRPTRTTQIRANYAPGRRACVITVTTEPGHEIRRINDATRRDVVSHEYYWSVALTMEQLRAWLSSAVLHDEGRHRCTSSKHSYGRHVISDPPHPTHGQLLQEMASWSDEQSKLVGGDILKRRLYVYIFIYQNLR